MKTETSTLSDGLRVEADRKIIARWRKDADQYMRQVEEARKAGTPHDQMLSMATALRQCAKELEDAGRVRNQKQTNVFAAASDLLKALRGLNHMGGDERGGYCICPRADGSAPDNEHSTACADARAAIAKAEGREESQTARVG